MERMRPSTQEAPPDAPSIPTAQQPAEPPKRGTGVESGPNPSQDGSTPPAHGIQYPDEFTLAALELDRHFKRCFFCHYGDRYTEDHFCDEGRSLAIAMHDAGEPV